MIANIWPLVTKPIVITAPGKYVTRCGEEVDIQFASNENKFACIGRYSDNIPDSWHRSGRLYFHYLSENDIVRKKDLV